MNSLVFNKTEQKIGQRQRILIANSKGGCGKTTLATNLACYFANQNFSTILVDHDPQESSIQWLCERHARYKAISGISAQQKRDNLATRSWLMRVPNDAEKIIIDTPSGLQEPKLSDLIRQSDVILVPVLPSAIDIRAATRFIQNLLLSQGFRRNHKQVAVVANRVRRNTLIYQRLKVFLTSLKIPFIATLRDTQYYVKASEQGLGLHDFNHLPPADFAEWQPLLQWLASCEGIDCRKT